MGTESGTQRQQENPEYFSDTFDCNIVWNELILRSEQSANAV